MMFNKWSVNHPTFVAKVRSPKGALAMKLRSSYFELIIGNWGGGGITLPKYAEGSSGISRIARLVREQSNKPHKF